MNKVKVFTSTDNFTREFIRCAKEYTHLKIAVAWCGNPEQTLPYKYLEDFRGKIEVILGYSFDHTHPDSFTWFRKINADLKIFRKEIGLFHPKIYLFLNGNRYALFIGSSNLTSSGFYSNIEINTLIEGTDGSKNNEVKKIKNQFKEWQRKNFSFKLSEQWLTDYRRKYKLNAKKEKDYGIVSSRRVDEEIGTASWLKNADWNTYYRKLLKGIAENEYNIDSLFRLLEKSEKQLKIPWRISYFEDIENRRIIEGLPNYGTLGHIGASGELRKLLAGKSKKKLWIITSSINNIGKMETPINWVKLENELKKLESLKLSMKVWGRFLSIVRPDLFCTVSSHRVRKNLSKTINVSQKFFASIDGYVKLIKMLHSSPWFNSKKPKNLKEEKYWGNRVALMDVIFYK